MEQSKRFGDCSERVIGACVEVHRELGPGLLESAYGQCLAYELGLRRLSFERQLRVPVLYKGVALKCDYRVDFLVERELIVEIKAVERLLPVHEAQVITYLKLLRVPAGLLVNFHSATIKKGLRRLNQNPPSRLPPSCQIPLNSPTADLLRTSPVQPEVHPAERRR